MKTKFLGSTETYDGQQLRSLFAYMNHGLLGDSAISWIGPCHVTFKHMVDGEDLRAKAKIEGSKMVHFLIEIFDCSLFAAVHVQRLLTSISMDYLRENSKSHFGKILHRDGDDIFAGDKKLSISIATSSPVSSMIHFAVNVSNAGTPVPTLSLEDLEIEPKTFAGVMLEKFSVEMQSARDATRKVRSVK
jgi:hypothetical protein